MHSLSVVVFVETVCRATIDLSSEMLSVSAVSLSLNDKMAVSAVSFLLASDSSLSDFTL